VPFAQARHFVVFVQHRQQAQAGECAPAGLPGARLLPPHPALHCPGPQGDRAPHSRHKRARCSLRRDANRMLNHIVQSTLPSNLASHVDPMLVLQVNQLGRSCSCNLILVVSAGCAHVSMGCLPVVPECNGVPVVWLSAPPPPVCVLLIVPFLLGRPWWPSCGRARPAGLPRARPAAAAGAAGSSPTCWQRLGSWPGW
jgi:hypothetical protein